MLLGYRVLRRMPRRVFRKLMWLRAGRFTVGLVTVVRWRGKVLFVEQRYRSGWSMPGGGINDGEQAEEGAARELREEVGLISPLTYRTHVIENDGVHNVMFVYTVDFADDEVPPIDAGIEIGQTRWAEPAELWPDLHREVQLVLVALGLAPPEFLPPTR